MNNIGDYPLGAKDDPRAPYNECENPEVEVSAYVYYTIGKSVKIKTSDYEKETGVDDTGIHSKLNFDDTDFSSLFNEICPPPEGWDELDCDFSIE